jgi:hypothetical protein
MFISLCTNKFINSVLFSVVSTTLMTYVYLIIIHLYEKIRTKDLTPKVVVMWLNTISHFRDELIRDYAGQAKESLIKAMKHENLECELTSQPIDSTEFNHGNEVYYYMYYIITNTLIKHVHR